MKTFKTSARFIVYAKVVLSVKLVLKDIHMTKCVLLGFKKNLPHFSGIRLL